jgi:ATP-dependent helicase HrpB
MSPISAVSTKNFMGCALDSDWIGRRYSLDKPGGGRKRASMTDLPIHAVLPELLGALRQRSGAVLVAPPGAGKTTAVAPALLSEPWCTGEVLLLSPRRLAARAAAERMAELAGERPGETIGYLTRLDSKRSARTRILVMTEGIFLARIQADPELAGVSAVLFDEVHERSLDSDFGLALALDAQAALRPDLRLLAMSATLDGARFARLMDDAPVVESSGRSHPITLLHLGRNAERRIEDEMAAACRRALAETDGSLLAFLPGVAEIERTAERLTGLAPDIDLYRLHGTLDPAEQRAAIRAAPPGRRKVVLATSIAETSLTLDGVRVVVDSGLARRPRYDRGAGITRLVTERASQASATQRAGRAGRQAPGTVYRLWEESATARPAAVRSARNPGSRPVRAAARLRHLGRFRSALAALDRSAAARRRGGSPGTPDPARRARRGRPADAARPPHRRLAAAAAPGPYADRSGRARLARDRIASRRSAFRARPRRQRHGP